MEVLSYIRTEVLPEVRKIKYFRTSVHNSYIQGYLSIDRCLYVAMYYVDNRHTCMYNLYILCGYI